MFEESYGSHHMAERPDSERDPDEDFETFGSSSHEGKESSNEELIDEVKKKYNSQADNLDEEVCSMIEAVLEEVEARYNPEDDHDKWIGVLKQLRTKVLTNFDAGNYDLAESNLLDLQQELERMA